LTVSKISNSFQSPTLHVTELTDPNQVRVYAESLAKQINDFRMQYNPPKRCIDLTSWIADVIIETSAQGSSLLEVHVIDPAWTLLMRDANDVSFIDVDDQGFLWPPVEVVFPQDKSDATWRLCQVRPSNSLTEANLILVFEDKIVSELREQKGPYQSAPNQSRAEFIQALVKKANKNPAYPGEVDIRFLALLPKSTFTAADLTLSERIPTSAKQTNAPKGRKNPNKTPSIGGILLKPVTPVQQAVEGVDLSIAAGYEAFLEGVKDAFSPFQGAGLGGNVGAVQGLNP